MVLDALQSKNAVAHKLSCSVIILYHWLRLHKLISPALFFYAISAFLIPHLSFLWLFFLSHEVPFLCLSLLLLNFCPTLRNFCLLLRPFAILLGTDPRLYSSIPLFSLLLRALLDSKQQAIFGAQQATSKQDLMTFADGLDASDAAAKLERPNKSQRPNYRSSNNGCTCYKCGKPGHRFFECQSGQSSHQSS